MRRSHAVILVVALLAEPQFAAGLRAQPARSATVGVIGGFSLTSLEGKDAADDLERRVGVLAGLSAVFSTPSRVQLEINGLYASKGFRSKGPGSTFDFTASYLEIPVLLRLSLAPAARVRPFLAAGPAFGMRLACSAEVTSTIGTEKLTCGDFERGLGVNVGKTDFSGVLGAGVEFTLGSMQSTLAARYSRGFSSVLGDHDNHFDALSVYVCLSRTRRR